jgi:SAM-dependent methyltransferase
MSHKEITKKSYQATAEEFTRNTADLAPLESIQKLIDLLPPHAKILDIGCGPGRDAKIFTEKGVSVLGIDFCENLLDIAKAHAPLAEFRLMDIETAAFPPSSFDGVWACCSLLHLPKSTLPAVLKNIHSFIKENGYFYLAVKQGTGEAVEKDSRYGEFEKFWSYYEENEIKELVEAAKFQILESCIIQRKADYHTHPGIRLFCKK